MAAVAEAAAAFDACRACMACTEAAMAASVDALTVDSTRARMASASIVVEGAVAGAVAAKNSPRAAGEGDGERRFLIRSCGDGNR